MKSYQKTDQKSTEEMGSAAIMGTNPVSIVYKIVDLSLITLVFFIVLKLTGQHIFEHKYLVLLLLALIIYYICAQSLNLYQLWMPTSLRDVEKNSFFLLRRIFVHLQGGQQGIIFRIYDAWTTMKRDKKASRKEDLFFSTSLITTGRIFVSWLTVCIFLWVFTYYTGTIGDYSQVAFGSWLLVTGLLLPAARQGLRFLIISLVSGQKVVQKVAIVGANQMGKKLGQSILEHPELGLELCGYFDDRAPERLESNLPDSLKGTIEDVIELARENRIHLIYMALPMRAEVRISKILKDCADTTVSVHLVPDFFVYNLLSSRWSRVGKISTLSVYDTPFFGVNSWLKRIQDLAVAIPVLILSFPLMLVISLAVWLTSKGPVLFKQSRSGLSGQTIDVWKFRTMTTMENGDEIIQVEPGDKRVTRVGRFLRNSSLDELPQFFNVLQGKMSIVGPRPHAVAHNKKYRHVVSGYMLRHKVKPGITGLAQISGWRGETKELFKMEGRVNCDLAYIREWSFWFDLKIIILTPWVMFRGCFKDRRSAELPGPIRIR